MPSLHAANPERRSSTSNVVSIGGNCPVCIFVSNAFVASEIPSALIAFSRQARPCSAFLPTIDRSGFVANGVVDAWVKCFSFRSMSSLVIRLESNTVVQLVTLPSTIVFGI